MSQNHSLKCKIDGPQSQIAKTPAEWKGDMKHGNKLQSVQLIQERGKKPSSNRSSLYDAAFHFLSHTPANKYI